jgi:hypothetical protein
LASCAANPIGKTAGNPNCAPSPAAETGARPYNVKFPYLSFIGWLSNNNFSNYKGLQFALTQRTWHGVSYVAGYTYSHALAESPDNWRLINPILSGDVRSLYGNSQFDVTHRFTYSLTYALPGKKSPGQILEGWSINSIVSIQSPMPWGINDVTTDFTGTNNLSDQASIGESLISLWKPPPPPSLQESQNPSPPPSAPGARAHWLSCSPRTIPVIFSITLPSTL